MAKLSMIVFFIALAFCVLQSTTAFRIARDAEEPTKNPLDVKNLSAVFDDAVDKFQEVFKDNFTKEQFEKIGENLKSFSDLLETKGKEFLQEAEAGVKKFQEKKE